MRLGKKDDTVTLTDLSGMAWAQTWQLTLLIVAILMLARGLGRNRPHLSHVFWLVVIVKCVTPPLWTSPGGVFCWLQKTVTSTPGMEFASALPLPGASIAIDAGRSEPRANGAEDRLPRPDPKSLATAKAKPVEVNAVIESMPTLWRTLLAFWITGCTTILCLAAVRWWRCWRTIQSAPTESRDDLSTALESLRNRLGVRSAVRLMITASQIGPAVLGIWHPVIVLPACIVRNKSARDLEPVLAHELIHLRRGDLWIGLGQVLAQSLWWFHPLVWLANRFLSRDAERCCDEEVIAELDCHPARYARSLLEVLELKRTLQPVPVFPGVRPVEVTSQRLERIMQLGHGCHKRTPWWCWLVLVLMAAIALPGAAFVAAGDKAKRDRQSRNDRHSEPQQSTTATEGTLDLVRTYSVRDVLTRIRNDLQQTEPDAKQTLEQLLRDKRFDEPQAKFHWSGRKLVVQHSTAGHERIAKRIQFFRDHGVHQVAIEVHLISGPPESIEKLHTHWELLSTLVMLRCTTIDPVRDAGAVKAAHAVLGAGPYGKDSPAAESPAPPAILPNLAADRPDSRIESRQAGARVSTKTYYVADLVIPIPKSVTLAVNPMDSVPAKQATNSGSAKQVTADFKTLIDLIQNSIRPDSWSNAGGSGAIEDFPTNLSLVISQTDEVHEQIADLLNQLRRLQDVQVSLECRVVGLPAGLDGKQAAISSVTQGGNVRKVRLATPQDWDEIQEHPSAKNLVLPKITLFNGQTLDLQIGSQESSFEFQLHPVVSPDGRSVNMDLSLRGSAENPPIKDVERTKTTLADGDTLLMDLPQTFRPEALGWSTEQDVPLLSKLPYVEKLFKNPSERAIERMYLLVTPRAIIREEEEQKLGIDVTKGRSR